MTKTLPRGNRELRVVVEARVEEGSLAVHDVNGYIRVPVRHAAPAGRGVQIDAGEAERRRDQDGSRLAIGTKCLAVHQQQSIGAARTPGVQNRSHRGDIGAEEIGDRLEPWCERNDGADIEIAIGPAIKPMTDAGSKRIVHGGMAQRALDADGLDLALLIEEA